jgi:hypothetical protein
MPEVASPDLAAWANFYVIVGSSAAALTGLTFVVITLVKRRSTTGEGVSTFTTPTVVHFCCALLLGALLAAPWKSLRYLGTILVVVGLCGTLYALNITLRTSRLTVYRPDVDDWIWYAIIPIAVYFTIVVAAVLLFVAPPFGLYACGAASLLLIFLGIHNAWDVVTYIALDPDDSESDGDDSR